MNSRLGDSEEEQPNKKREAIARVQIGINFTFNPYTSSFNTTLFIITLNWSLGYCLCLRLEHKQYRSKDSPRAVWRSWTVRRAPFRDVVPLGEPGRSGIRDSLGVLNDSLKCTMR